MGSEMCIRDSNGRPAALWRAAARRPRELHPNATAAFLSDSQVRLEVWLVPAEGGRGELLSVHHLRPAVCSNAAGRKACAVPVGPVGAAHLLAPSCAPVTGPKAAKRTTRILRRRRHQILIAHRMSTTNRRRGASQNARRPLAGVAQDLRAVATPALRPTIMTRVITRRTARRISMRRCSEAGEAAQTAALLLPCPASADCAYVHLSASRRLHKLAQRSESPHR